MGCVHAQPDDIALPLLTHHILPSGSPAELVDMMSSGLLGVSSQLWIRCINDSATDREPHGEPHRCNMYAGKHSVDGDELQQKGLRSRVCCRLLRERIGFTDRQ